MQHSGLNQRREKKNENKINSIIRVFVHIKQAMPFIQPYTESIDKACIVHNKI